MTKESWPPNYLDIVRWRNEKLIALTDNPQLLKAAKIYYAANPAQFIEDWCNTYDPRNAGNKNTDIPARMPFVLFQRQKDLVNYIYQLVDGQENGLIEKARDMGATWVCAAISVHMFLFRDGSAVGWGSRKEQLVDRLGDPDSIFEKMRMLIRGLPAFFVPAGFNDSNMGYMKMINPENGSSITGEAGDNIGRGGRKLIYFKDESAHYERPEKIEAALADNTNVQVDISSVNGLGNVFHRRREAGIEWEGAINPNSTNIFVMAWDDNPMKTQEWYEARRKKATEEGMLHVFEQEVNRNYASSVENVLIPSDWVTSAIDAHIKLGFEDDGGYVAGLDVADAGRDTNAQALRKGVVLRDLLEWSVRDTGVTTRKSVGMLKGKTVSVQYDSIGVGAGVKSEVNRLAEVGDMPNGLTYTSWNAGSGVLNPDEHMYSKADGHPDKESPINKDFYTNLKAQAGWQLRLRFERTHKAVTQGIKYDSDELISIDSTLPKLRKLQKELSQATHGQGAKFKMLIDKTPEGSKSPNLADAVSMCYFPIPIEAPAKTSQVFTPAFM